MHSCHYFRDEETRLREGRNQPCLWERSRMLESGGNDVWPGKEKEMSQILRGWWKGTRALIHEGGGWR